MKTVFMFRKKTCEDFYCVGVWQALQTLQALQGFLYRHN